MLWIILSICAVIVLVAHFDEWFKGVALALGGIGFMLGASIVAGPLTGLAATGSLALAICAWIYWWAPRGRKKRAQALIDSDPIYTAVALYLAVKHNSQHNSQLYWDLVNKFGKPRLDAAIAEMQKAVA